MNPWLKAAVQGAACGLVFGAVVLPVGRLWWPQLDPRQAKEAGVADVVKARRFELVPVVGKARAALSVTPFTDQPQLEVVDAEGRMRVFLMLPDGDPHLLLYDAAGTSRAVLSLSKDGSPSLRLWDEAGKLRVALGGAELEQTKTAEVTMRPESFLVLFDKAGKVIWQAP